jgi:hypothetical protein
MVSKNISGINTLFNLVLKEGLTPNQIYLLDCIKNNITTIHINFHQEIRTLTHTEWLIKNDEKYILAPKSYTILEKVESYFNVQKKKTSMITMGVDFKDNIKKYQELFPKGKLPSGKPARSNDKILEQNFRWFFENYSYTWDTILKTTAYYIDEFEKKNFLYMRTAQYFICKTELDKTKSSELADYCSMIESGDFDTSNNHFKENVI